MGICQNRSQSLGGTSSHKIARPRDCVIPPGPLAAALDQPLLAQLELGLDLLVQDPLQRALRDAQVAGAEALEEARGALVAQDLADAVPAVAVGAGRDVADARGVVLVELQPRLDEPDGVGRRARDDAGRHGARQVHHGVGGVEPRPLRVDALACAVDVKVDGARGHHAHQVGSQSLEERPRALESVHVAQNLHRLGRVVCNGAQRAEPLLAHGLARRSQLCLVEIGLETGLEDVERGGQNSCCCASDTVVLTQTKRSALGSLKRQE